MSKATLVCLADIEAEEIEWLWPGYIPRGMVSLIVGEPGVGKSTVTWDLLSRLTKGDDWPDGAPGLVGNGLVISAEDQLANRVVSQMESFGADLGRVHSLFVDEMSPLRLDDDLQWLETAAMESQCDLIVLDPLYSFLGDVNPNRGDEMRSITNKLARLAERTRAAVLLVHHLNKNERASAKNRVLGAIDIVGAARSVLELKEDALDLEVKVLHRTKGNLSECPKPMLYSWNTDGTLKWSVAPDAYDCSRRAVRGGVVGAAVEWLVGMMEEHNQQIRSKVLSDESHAAGISRHALEKAKAVLGGKAQYVKASPPYWVWYIGEYKKPKESTITT